jgi:23S rRNA pseudouridine2457 synthase
VRDLRSRPFVVGLACVEATYGHREEADREHGQERAAHERTVVMCCCRRQGLGHNISSRTRARPHLSEADARGSHVETQVSMHESANAVFRELSPACQTHVRPPRCGDVILAFHKPYGVLSRFTRDGSPHATLAEFGFPRDVYAVGRLDADSEGLLVLTDEARVTGLLLDPVRGHVREYWVQVDREIDDDALASLERGVVIQGETTRPARARKIAEPILPPRNPPVRFRKNVPTSWIALELTEGKNRQVRKMTAAVGFPTLRLYRARIGRFTMADLAPGQWRTLAPDEIEALLPPSSVVECAAAGPRRPREHVAPRRETLEPRGEARGQSATAAPTSADERRGGARGDGRQGRTRRPR